MKIQSIHDGNITIDINQEFFLRLYKIVGAAREQHHLLDPEIIDLEKNEVEEIYKEYKCAFKDFLSTSQ